MFQWIYKIRIKVEVCAEIIAIGRLELSIEKQPITHDQNNFWMYFHQILPMWKWFRASSAYSNGIISTYKPL